MALNNFSFICKSDPKFKVLIKFTEKEFLIPSLKSICVPVLILCLEKCSFEEIILSNKYTYMREDFPRNQ